MLLLVLLLSHCASLTWAQGREVPPGPGGTGTEQAPPQPGSHDTRAPCTAESVQLQRGEGDARLELPRQPQATEHRSDSGFFPRRMCQTPQNTCRHNIFSFPHSFPNDTAFSG